MAFGDGTTFGNTRKKTISNSPLAPTGGGLLGNFQTDLTPLLNGGYTQASVGGINLETGRPLSGGTNNITGYTGPTAIHTAGGSMPLTEYASGYQRFGGSGISQAPISGAGGTGMSNSDAFFAEANAPMTPRVASVQPTGANAGANYNTAVLNSLISQYQKSSDQARADSLAQHDALMANVTGTMGKVDKYLAELGETGKKRIAENEARDLGQAEQDAVSRGLGNTTIRGSMVRGVKNDAEDKRQQLDEMVAGQKIGTSLDLTKLYGDALLSRVNVAPDNSYLALIQQLAASGGGVGGSGLWRKA